MDVLSFWGPEPVPLPSRFARIKRNLIAGHEEELQASWSRLITALRAEVDHIETLGSHLIPSIEFSDIKDTSQTARFKRDLRRYGVGVVRKVVSRPEADSAISDTIRYINARRKGTHGTGPIVEAVNGASNGTSNGTSNGHGGAEAAPLQDPACLNLFWTPAQVRCRAHPNVLATQSFMMGLWEPSPDDRLSTQFPCTYVDRIRIHGLDSGPAPGSPAAAAAENDPQAHTDSNPAKPEHNGTTAAAPSVEDDWITALQSSAGVIAQVDNGSLERWEPDGYQRAGAYNHVFDGHWEEYDPWECATRASATMDLYNGYGACTIYRMFQGVLSLSTIEPGMIRLLPSPKLVTAYYLLRPFFTPKVPPPDSSPSTGTGPEWDAYLAADNWELQKDPDTIIHGAVPGHAQRITEHWHPHLHLRGSMITLPTLQPGDYIFWHPDLAYHISNNTTGLTTPHGSAPNPSSDDVNMLVYIAAAPLTQTNALYLARQRKSFQRRHPPPDFDSAGRGPPAFDPTAVAGEKVMSDVGGSAALQAMGLAPRDVADSRAATPSERGFPEEKNKDINGIHILNGEKSPTMASTSSGSETDVVRLTNQILFPDTDMTGYSV